MGDDSVHAEVCWLDAFNIIFKHINIKTQYVDDSTGNIFIRIRPWSLLASKQRMQLNFFVQKHESTDSSFTFDELWGLLVPHSQGRFFSINEKLLGQNKVVCMNRG